MYKKIFNDFDKIKVPKAVVEQTVCRALQVNKEDSVADIIKKHRGVAFGLIAACLAVVFVLTAVIGIVTKSEPLEVKDSRFIITANAKQVELMGDKVKKSTIGAYSSGLTGGWAMYQNLEIDEDSSPNFFQSFAFSMFEIEGDDIASVTFKANTPGTYFAISPMGFFTDIEKNVSEYEQSLKRYSDLSLTNSQYSAEELTSNSDGLAYGNIYCDTFTYTNSDNLRKINFSNKLEYVLESNHNNPTMSENLDRLWECEKELMELKKNYIYEGGELSEKEEKLWAEIDLLTQEIRGLILNGSTIDVIVTFKDGSTEKKILKTDLVNTDDQRMWLTISE